MRTFETISDCDLVRYAVSAIETAINDTNGDYDELSRLEDQKDELLEYLDWKTRDRPIDRVKRVRLPKNYGAWYYQRIETDDDGEEVTIFNLYDDSGQFVNEFRDMEAVKKYCRTGKYV